MKNRDSCELGTILVALKAREELSLPEILQKEGFTKKQIHSTAVSMINRLVNLVSAMQKQFPDAEKATVIVDGGKGSKDNLTALKAAVFEYLVARRHRMVAYSSHES